MLQWLGLEIGVWVPVGQPRPAEISDQFVASALIPVPPNYAANGSQYHVDVSAGRRTLPHLILPAEINGALSSNAPTPRSQHNNRLAPMARL